ncbi:hypothetical protein GCM10009721_11750 [Terrabacter tumescens]|uniref:Uncharacterized protein n=1 Tax=Terrabacter tumescens TaxID=60443 RepID=A0ABQ2HS40_9MICO|nr:hypothetical protein GCM10009721_11750 [Terrabacter tumescens]
MTDTVRANHVARLTASLRKRHHCGRGRVGNRGHLAHETGLYQVSGGPSDELRELECPSLYACVVAG